MKKKQPKDYWDKNIERWGQFYLEESHLGEEFYSSKFVSFIYRIFIVPIESRLMEKRFKLTMDFVENFSKPGITIADVGCGTGIFTVEMLKRGARVKALDLSTVSLKATQKNVEREVPEFANSVEYIHSDLSVVPMPKVDVALAMGVTPYVTDITKFYDNILPFTNVFFCLILDPRHWANRVRGLFPFLNVRNMHFFERNLVDQCLTKHGFELRDRMKFSSGYLDLIVRSEK